MNKKVQAKHKNIHDQAGQELKALEQAISPKKFTKEYQWFIQNANQNKKLQLSLIRDHQRQSKTANLAKKSNVLPLLLYQFFTQKWVRATFFSRSHFLKKQSEKKSQISKKQKIFPQTPQEIRDEFLKDNKNNNLIKIIQQNLEKSSVQLQKKPNQYSKRSINFQLQKFELTIDLQEQQQSLDGVLELFSSFFCILTALLQNWSVKISTLKIKLKNKGFKFEDDTFKKFSQSFWRLVSTVKIIQSFEIMLPKIQQFWNPIFVQLDQKEQKSEDDNCSLKSMYRLQIHQIKTDENQRQVNLNYLIPSLQKCCNLKSFLYNICWMGNQQNVQFVYKSSFELFKTISQSNSFIENICFNFKLSYDSIQKEQDQKLKEKQDFDHTQDKPNEDSQILDRNLFWLRKMQQNCPYLAGVKFEFQKMSQTEDRRLSIDQREQYVEKLKKTREIMNHFFKRAMNAQTFFNSIKIMQTEGFDFETILGVLDRIQPFAPR